MIIYAIINKLAKSVPEDAHAQLEEFLSSRGIEHEIVSVVPEDICDSLQNISRRSQQSEAIPCIVWGGDGTIACALENLAPEKFSVIALPGGTMNLVHQAIHGMDVSWQEILEVCLERGKTIEIPRGRVGDQHFYVAILLGKLAQLAIPREELRENNLIGAVAEALSNEELLDIDPALEIEIGNSVVKQASAMGVGIDKSMSHVFDVGLIHPNSLMDLASIGFQSLIGDWHEVDDIERLQVQHLVVNSSNQREIDVTLDGEFQKLEVPLEIVFEPAAVKVVSARS